jgi:hypothetical protein
MTLSVGADLARRNLGRVTAMLANVRAILVLPGWFVTLKANSELKVLNAKQIPGFVSKEPPVLADAAAERIVYQLDQRCRDGEV